MESLFLTIKFVMFYGFEVFVVAVAGGAVITWLYQIIRNRVRADHVPASVRAN